MMRQITIIASSLLLGGCLMTGQNKGGAAAKGDAAKGKEVFEQCAVCHSADSPEMKMGPSLQGLFKHKMLKTGKPVTDANVMEQINNGGNGMPAYQDQLTAQEKDNLMAYLKTL